MMAHVRLYIPNGDEVLPKPVPVPSMEVVVEVSILQYGVTDRPFPSGLPNVDDSQLLGKVHPEGYIPSHIPSIHLTVYWWREDPPILNGQVSPVD